VMITIMNFPDGFSMMTPSYFIMITEKSRSIGNLQRADLLQITINYSWNK